MEKELHHGVVPPPPVPNIDGGVIMEKLGNETAK